MKYLLQHKDPMVSVMIFTLNEALHLPSCLKSLQWCTDIIIIDSGSDDDTRSICNVENTRFFEHPFQGFGKQRNWAIENTEPRYDWILILDADESVPESLALEMIELANKNPRHVGAARVRRRLYMWGKWLRYSSLYPNWVVRLIHKDRVRYINRGHAETQTVDGEVLELESDLIDENKKGIEQWFARQNRYSTKEARYELDQEKESQSMLDLFSNNPLTRRKQLKRLSWNMPFRSLVYFIYSYFIRQGFRDGKNGYRFCQMKAIYQNMIVIKKKSLRDSADE